MTVPVPLSRLLIPFFCLCLLFASVGEAAAQDDATDASSEALPVEEDANRSPFEIWWGFDIGLTTGVALIGALPRAFVDELVSAPCIPPHAGAVPTGAQQICNKDTLNALDKPVAGYNSKLAAQLSDIGFIVNIAAPFAFDLLDVLISDPSDGWLGLGKDYVILAETFAVAAAVNTTVAVIWSRPRPLVYDEDRDLENRLDGNQYLSFPSGHVLVAFAMATAYSWIFTERHPDHWLVVPVWTTTYLLATSAGVGRIFAGEHFPTDVLIGAAVGIGIGLMIPWLHTPDDEFDTDILMPGDKQAQVDLMMTPMVVDSGTGVMFTVRHH